MKHHLLVVVISYLFILAVVLFDRKFSVGMWREILTSSLLSLLQLILIGFAILFFLNFKNPLINVLFVIFFYVNGSIIA
ncbi:MAG: ABC transporter permease, partial [Desulfurobacteriaceae bacterium]